jgi:uncharacterized protein involved in exopolysaccharide biosynthesis
MTIIRLEIITKGVFAVKKFISGVIVGALLFGGASAFAASSSLIGQKVQGLFSIEKAGVKVADAVIINGSAYAPVRAVATATGAGLTVEGKKIIMDETTISTAAEVQVQINALNFKREDLTKQIQAAEGGIKMYETTYIPNAERNFNGALTEVEKTGSAAALEARKAELEQRKAELATLQQQLTDLDAQIAALQK